jgi:hypothetical protein
MGWNSAANAQAQANQTAMMLNAIGAQQQQQSLQQGQQQQLAALEKAQAQAVPVYQPYSQFGQQSLNALAKGMGLTPGGGEFMRQPTLAELQMDPGYAFRQQQGQKALQQQLAAGGLGGSGSALKAATRFGQDMASQEYGNAYNRFMANRANQIGMLQGGANTGFGAAQGIGNIYMGTGTNLANVFGNTAQSLAASQAGAAQAGGQNLVNTGSTYANAAMAPTNLMAALAGQGVQAIGSGLGMRYGQTGSIY